MELILGGARSGKSRLAQTRAEHWQAQGGGQLVYLATATAGDAEMQARIARHQADRQGQWCTLEEPLYLAEALSRSRDTDIVLVDCLTLWISNCLHAGCWPQERAHLLAQIDRQLAAGRPPRWLFVSNEVGSGVIPLGRLSREFVDASGWLHQALAQRCAQVSLVVAGLPLSLKSSHE
ncbi:bifunctional adenosylcobinamide kinase/adenosylcobinamide-phosphate guanylyltransferase [Cellvibrio japonicus]|uniref:Bifunctional adenosylcobalamin biosynthesis protein n=1 Tax=Cellvibrio japonicus (strain Ueda107) TaxID=498211 RepID=B3PIN8_CELJU|nr:bifunctional adenosylcobinamide kinase/adenosylcobinamide-phosphate guanylyltransferase [Cellvibrio japonicus]ACE82934.1 cobinamide kinase [Cellvibrio japonicus Ueda107]QEI13956.1 bifunctional adenosylcobinamide kinase/adenosylcobinamide-phosphate guanylyltransferase [Cellvibrio japonicus]QEI17530.1 bifunctional adenosylcobinamide kinase/adenosylcobinamide-phosphate guanylyltransferase [Cellvibrio japonicus]QEI21106.1 bifunctional adenosylcobinamide kinase/adenosylcobinamide-phosphate guanyl